MNFRITLLLFCLGLVIAGGELLSQSRDMPEWSDTARAIAVQNWDFPDDHSGPAYEAYNRHWFAAIDALRTDKWPYHDAGAALIGFGICLAAALFLLRINTLDDFSALRTPHSPWTVYLITAVGWFGYMGSAMAAMVQGFNRFEFPPWADSLYIPIIYIAVAALTGWILISVVMWIVLRHAPLPVSLWIWRKDLPMHNGLYTAITVLALAVGVEILRETYCYGHWSAVPMVFLCCYAALCVRAAGISRAAMAETGSPE